MCVGIVHDERVRGNVATINKGEANFNKYAS